MLDTPTKAMVMGAAAAIILAAGIYLFKEYSAYSERAEREASIENARRQLFQWAGAPDGDRERVRTFCLGAASLAEKEPSSDEYRTFTRRCRALGYL